MAVPAELTAVSENVQAIVDEILAMEDDQQLVDFLDSNELKLLYKCQAKSFELMQLLINLKSKIQLRNKSEKKSKKKS